jgi:dTDP-4-amino-4,6-dideoxygalactose transaminase
MRVPLVDLQAQYRTIQAEIDAAIASVIRRSAFIRGADVDQFEEAWARLLGVRCAVSCANGTDALYIALRAMGVQAGDEVITTAHSWISTSESITQAGGRVVFCDTDPVTFTLDPHRLEEKITARTVGIVPVHLYGHPAAMDPIMRIARARGLWVIEDCAQAHLARYHGQLVGTFGNAATFSFYPGKNLGAYGDAGCVVTNDEAVADWMATFARHGGKGDHVMEGINSRMDGLQAAVLNVKLPHLPAWTAARRAVASRYDELLGGLDGLATPSTAADCEHVFHLYVVRTARRDALQASLAEAGITTAVNYPRALPYYPAYSHLGHTPADFPVAHANQSTILSLPVYPEITEPMIAYVAERIGAFLGQARPVEG